MGPYHSPGESPGGGAEVGSRDPGFAEMSADFFGGGEPAATPEPAPEPVQPSPEPAAASQPAPVEATSAPAQQAAPEPKKWRVSGKDYTLAELEKAGLLDRLIPQAEQVAHFQSLYEREKADRERLAAERAQPPPAPAAAPEFGPSSDELYLRYKPSIDALIKQGDLDEDVAAFPKTLARMFYLSEIVTSQGQVLGAIQGALTEAFRGHQGTQVRNKIEALSDAVARRGPVFSELSDQAKRGEFFNWIAATVNPPVDSLTEELVARLWAAYKQPEWIGMAETAASAQKAAEDAKRRQAKGEGGGARPGIPTEKSKKDLEMEEMSEGYLPPLRR